MGQKLLVMGATSGIGKAALETALEREIPVRAFSRTADEIPAGGLLETFAGDATKPEDVAGALEGVTAVIYALGIRERVAMLWEEETLFSESTRILIDAMKDKDVSRIIAVTGFGAGRSKAAMSSLERLGFMAVLRKPYEDKDRQEELLMNSGLDWTIARPVILTNGAATGKTKVLRKPETWRNGIISRRDVAAYLVDAAVNGLDVGSDVVLAR